MNLYFNIYKKHNIMAQGDEEQYRSTNICWFCEKFISSKEV